MSLWDEVHAALRAGRTPSVSLTLKEDLVRPPKGKPGRPKSSEEAPFDSYVASDLLGARKRPTCLNPACSKRVRKNQYTCNDVCKTKAIRFFRVALFYLGGTRLKALPKPPKKPVLPFVATSRPLPQAGEKLLKARRTRHGLLPKL